MSPAPRNPPPFLASVVSSAHEHILPSRHTYTHVIFRVWILGREKERRERRGRESDKEVGMEERKRKKRREGEGRGEKASFFLLLTRT